MIIITTQCFAPQIGGIESLMTGMAEAMAKAGKDVLVLADGFKNNADKKVNYKIKRFSGWKPIRRLNKARYLERICENKSVETIYADSWKSVEYVRKKNKKILVLAHGTEIPKQYKGIVLNALKFKKNRIIKSYKNVFKIIANSNYTRDLMNASLKIGFEKIKIIHPGIDVYEDFISQEDEENVKKIIKNRKPIISTLARVEERKGHKFIINAISKLTDKFPNLIYLIAGKGPYLEEIKKYVNDLSLENHVVFLGWITEPEKSLILKNSEVFAMTPTTVGESVEGFGMAFIDAAFHGIPSVGSKSGGISDAIVENETGLLAEAGNQEEITKKLTELLDNVKLRAKLGKRGKEIAESQYSWDNKIIEYLEAAK